MSIHQSAINVQRIPFPAPGALEQLWRDLQGRSQDHSFFVSWDWIGPWLEHLPPRIERSLIKLETEGRLVGLAVVCERTIKRNGVSSRALYFNCSGDPELDELTIEYNDLLVETGLHAQALRSCLEHLNDDPGWDELFFDGWQNGELLIGAALGLPGQFIEHRRRPTHLVDLRELRRVGQSQLDTLPRKVRYNARRAFKLAEELGAIRLDPATSVEEAQRFLVGLRELHELSWQKKGLPGAFANDFFSGFHNALVGRHSARHVVQLLRLSVGEAVVGYLYNFAYGQRVYNYQSGFDFEYSDENSWRPGIMCHLEAIEFNKGADMNFYDFMAGDHAYKKELGTPAQELVWLTFQRPRLKFQVENRLRSLWTNLRT